MGKSKWKVTSSSVARWAIFQKGIEDYKRQMLEEEWWYKVKPESLAVNVVTRKQKRRAEINEYIKRLETAKQKKIEDNLKKMKSEAKKAPQVKVRPPKVDAAVKKMPAAQKGQNAAPLTQPKAAPTMAPSIPNKDALQVKTKETKQPAKMEPITKTEKEQPKQQKGKDAGQQRSKKENKANAKDISKPADMAEGLINTMKEKIEDVKIAKMEDNTGKITPQKISLPTIPQLPSNPMQAFTGERVPVPKDYVAPAAPQLKEGTSFPQTPKDTKKQPFIPKQTLPAGPKQSPDNVDNIHIQGIDKSTKIASPAPKEVNPTSAMPKMEAKDIITGTKQDCTNSNVPIHPKKDILETISPAKSDLQQSPKDVKLETSVKPDKGVPMKEIIPETKSAVTQKPIISQQMIPQPEQQQNKPQITQEPSKVPTEKHQSESKSPVPQIPSAKPTDKDAPKLGTTQAEGKKPAPEKIKQTQPAGEKKSILEVLTSNVKTVLPKIMGQNKSSAKSQPQVEPVSPAVEGNMIKPIDIGADQSTGKDKAEKPIVAGPKMDTGKSAQTTPQKTPVDIFSDKSNQVKPQDEKHEQPTTVKEHPKLTISEKRQRRKTKSGEKDTPAQGKPTQEKPTQEKPPQEKLPQEKPAQEKPPQEKPAQEKPAQEKPAQEKPGQEKPAQEKPAQEKPAQEKSAQEKPAQEKPAQGKPAQEKPPSPLSKKVPAEVKIATKLPTQEKEMPKSDTQKSTENIAQPLEIAANLQLKTPPKDKTIPAQPQKDNLLPTLPAKLPQDKNSPNTPSNEKEVSKPAEKSTQDKCTPKSTESVPSQPMEEPTVPAKISQQEKNAPKIPKEIPACPNKESKVSTETTLQEKEKNKLTTEASKQNKEIPKVPVITPTKEKENLVAMSKSTLPREKEIQKPQEKSSIKEELVKDISPPADSPRKHDELPKTEVSTATANKDKSTPKLIGKDIPHEKEIPKLPSKSVVHDKGACQPGEEIKEKKPEQPLSQGNITEPTIQTKPQDKSQAKGAQAGKKQNVKDVESVKSQLKNQNKNEAKTKIPKQQKGQTNQGVTKAADKPVPQQVDNKEIKSPSKPGSHEVAPSSPLPEMTVKDKPKAPDTVQPTVDKKVEEAKKDSSDKASKAKSQAKGKRVRQRSKRDSESDKEKTVQITKEPAKISIPPVHPTDPNVAVQGFAAAAKKPPIMDLGKDKIAGSNKSATENIRLGPEMQPPKAPLQQPKRELDNSKTTEQATSLEQRMQAAQALARNQPQIGQGSPTLRSGPFASDILSQPPPGLKPEPPVIPMRQGVSTLNSSSPTFIPLGQGAIPTQSASQITFGTPMSPPITGQAIPPQYQQGPNTTQFQQGQNTTQYHQGPNPAQYQQGPNPAQYQQGSSPSQYHQGPNPTQFQSGANTSPMSYPRGIPPSTQFSPGQGVSSYFQPGQGAQQPFVPQRFGQPSPMGRAMGNPLPRGRGMAPSNKQQTTFLTQEPDDDVQVPDLFDNFL